MSDCTHELHERETASADGMCPICLASERGALAERVEKLERALAAMVRKVEGPVTDWNERHPAVPHPATRALNEARAALLARPSTPPTEGVV